MLTRVLACAVVAYVLSFVVRKRKRRVAGSPPLTVRQGLTGLIGVLLVWVGPLLMYYGVALCWIVAAGLHPSAGWPPSIWYECTLYPIGGLAAIVVGIVLLKRG